MVTRILVPLCAGVWVSVAWGLGLGSLEVQSNLDQPLDGVIELRLADGDYLASIDARIASRDEFEDLGIDYPSYLGSVRLMVEQRGTDSVLRLLSDSVINEPFVHLLVRVDWSGGSFLREYTVLIDPPIYAAEAPPAISQSRMVETQSQSAESRFSPEVADEMVDAQYGPVVAGESLSQIASDLQAQFPDLSIYQIMKVMFEENRGAFIEGNINGLLMGSILKIGDINAIRAVDLADARSFYRTQLQDWDPAYLIADSQQSTEFSNDENLRVGQDDYAFSDEVSTDGYQSDGGDFSTTVDAAVDSNADLFRVGAASDADTFVSDSQSNSSAGEVIALRSQITQLEASMASSEQENQELTERISILEGQLSDLNRLMSLGVEDADLANLEATLAAQNAANDAADALLDGDLNSLNDESETESELVNDLTQDSDLNNDELGEDGIEILDLDQEDIAALNSGLSTIESTTDSSIEESDQSTQNQNTPRTIQVKGSQGFLGNAWDSVQDSGVGRLIAGVGGILLAGLALLVYRRRRADEEFEISMLSIETNSTTQIQDADERHSGFENSRTEEAPKGDKETSFLTVYSDSDAVVQADEVDPIAEADVYIAYGRDEQAEEVLLDGVASNPTRVDIKQKLLGLYHKNENTQGFERIAEELYGQRETVSDSDWANVIAMGKEISPENPLFDDESANPISSFGSGVSPARTNVNPVNPANAEPIFETEKGPEASDEQGVELVQFDDVRSELSELDQVEINALDLAPATNGGQARARELESKAAKTQSRQDSDLLYDLDEELTLNADNISYDIDDEEFNNPAPKAKDPLEESSVIDFSDASGSAVDLSEDDDDLDAMSDLDVASSYDEARTQFELAKVFVDLGDEDGAKKILRELAKSDDIDDDVLSDAIALLDSIDG